MDKLFNKKSRLGWLSTSPVLIVALLVILVSQSITVYVDVVKLSEKYHLGKPFIEDLKSLFNSHIVVGMCILGFFGIVLLLMYLFERSRVKRQTKDLSKNLDKLSILSLIKEKSRHCTPREKV
jgi:ABC-type Fe3+ transport system permease subunit